MAIFTAFNAAGTGFNMTSTNSSGWTFMMANPAVSLSLTYDDGSEAHYDVYGSALIDEMKVRYASDGYNIFVKDLLYKDDGYSILSITGLDLYTTTEDLGSNAWYMTLNGGHDTFYGNDYADVIRAGFGGDVVSGYGGDDILYGDGGYDDIFGGEGEDDLYGGTGRDYLSGGSGSDYLNGGADIDTLEGGAGNDYFAFNTKASRSNVDTIADFNPLEDTIMLDNKVFTRVGRDGWLKAGAFTTGAKAHDSSDRVIYNKGSGALLYDPDGIGGVAATKIAQLKAGLEITKYDFYVL